LQYVVPLKVLVTEGVCHHVNAKGFYLLLYSIAFRTLSLLLLNVSLHMFNLSNVRGISGVELKAAVGFEGFFYILH